MLHSVHMLLGPMPLLWVLCSIKCSCDVSGRQLEHKEPCNTPCSKASQDIVSLNCLLLSWAHHPAPSSWLHNNCVARSVCNALVDTKEICPAWLWRRENALHFARDVNAGSTNNVLLAVSYRAQQQSMSAALLHVGM